MDNFSIDISGRIDLGKDIGPQEYPESPYRLLQ
jgi:hypothetical protein